MKTNTLGSRWELKELPQDSVNRKRISSSGVSNFNESVSGLDPEITFRILSSKLQRVAHNAEAEGLKYRDLKELIEEKYTGDIESLQYTGKVGIQTQGNEIYWGHFDNNLKAVAKRHGQGLIFDENTGLIKIVEYDKGEIKPGSRITELYGDGDIESRIEGAKEFYKYIKATDVSFYGSSSEDASCYEGVSRSKGQLFQGVHKTLSYSPDKGRLVTVTGVEEIGALHGKDLTLNGSASKIFIDGTKIEGIWQDGSPVPDKKYTITLKDESVLKDIVWKKEGFGLNDVQLLIPPSSQYQGSFRLINFDPSKRFNVAFQEAKLVPIDSGNYKSEDLNIGFTFDNQGCLERVSSPVCSSAVLGKVNSEIKDSGQNEFDIRKNSLNILLEQISSSIGTFEEEIKKNNQEKAEDVKKMANRVLKAVVCTILVGIITYPSLARLSEEKEKPAVDITKDVSELEEKSTVESQREDEYNKFFSSYIRNLDSEIVKGDANAKVLRRVLEGVSHSKSLRDIYVKSKMNIKDLRGFYLKVSISVHACLGDSFAQKGLDGLFHRVIKYDREKKDFYNAGIDLVYNHLPENLKSKSSIYKFVVDGEEISILQLNKFDNNLSGEHHVFNYLVNKNRLAELKQVIQPAYQKKLNEFFTTYSKAMKANNDIDAYEESKKILKFLDSYKIDQHLVNFIDYWNHCIAEFCYLNESSVGKNWISHAVDFSGLEPDESDITIYLPLTEAMVKQLEAYIKASTPARKQIK